MRPRGGGVAVSKRFLDLWVKHGGPSVKWGGVEDLRAGDPRMVGPYRLLKRLGGGGMGQVFLGRSRGGRLVAVKVVRPELAMDVVFRRRFTREVSAAQRVGGFFTAHVVDADTMADPPWLATAYIPGPSLHQAVERHGPLQERVLETLTAGLAEGLAAVHGCQLVHRDLKPGNILLAADGPRLIDFGIARAVEDTYLTGTGRAVGTPGFMAPEHLLGNQAGPASDVFSLGAVIAYAATGRLPFGTGVPHAVNYRVVHEPPDLSELPVPLAALVADCLAKDALRRPTVEQILDHVALSEETGISWLTPTLTTMIADRDVTPLMPYDTVSREAEPDTGKDDGADRRRPKEQKRERKGPNRQVDALLRLANLEAEAGNLDEGCRLFRQAIEADGTPEQTADAHNGLGWYETKAGNLDEGRRQYQQVIETGPLWHKAWALNCRGILEENAGNVEDGRKFYKQAIDMDQWGNSMTAAWNLAMLEARADNLEEARRLFQQSIDADGSADRRDEVLMHWADMERDAGNHERSRQLYQQILNSQ
ncbi:protein kinase domain-containing protein [Streptomyces atratus]|uniref:serine/threonine-protein kinase n=1 Tax=Streptomyces atratus TaxID=1893 RepID=UPI0037D996FB